MLVDTVDLIPKIQHSVLTVTKTSVLAIIANNKDNINNGQQNILDTLQSILYALSNGLIIALLMSYLSLQKINQYLLELQHKYTCCEILHKMIVDWTMKGTLYHEQHGIIAIWV